jgi:hypothetical protein
MKNFENGNLILKGQISAAKRQPLAFAYIPVTLLLLGVSPLPRGE